MTDRARQPLWYKDAIIYEIHVRAFADSNGDGIGDFKGLTDRLDYLQELGITAIWLLPFYPSPLRDGGYDIADYTEINPDYGSMRDFTRFVKEAHARDMRVITELVVNHTSDQHPWFQRARRAPKGSAHRDWYVWSDNDDRYPGTRIIFTDTETSNWAWDPVAGQYYWHRFFTHQPDLNYENPRVREAIKRVMKFWFDKGVDGMRLDAVPYLREREGTNNENLPETHEVLKEWRAYVDEHYDDKMLLAEANQWPEDVRAYFGDGDECHMAFHFPIMPRLFMALRQEERRPIVDILDQTPPIPPTCQWALFLRNHDELTLEMVTDEERDYMYAIYATDPRMRVNVGIRRRLAPLLDNNRRAIELLHGLLFSLPGTPIIYYGDEIGMGDNIFLGDRDGVRTPMQWNGDRNGGFSRADPAKLFLPPIMDPLYGYQAVNVDAQERSSSSLLNWMRRMIALRRRRPALGHGELLMLHPDNRSVLAFLRRHGDDITLVIANLSRFVQPVRVELPELAGMTPVEVIGQQNFPPIGEDPYFLTLAPHAFYWFDLVPQPEPPAPVLEGVGPVVRVSGDWPELLEGEAIGQLEREVLPEYLVRQRWFGGREGPLPGVRVREVVPLRRGAAPAWLLVADTESEGVSKPYVLALTVASGRAARRMLEEMPAAAVVRVESARGRGVLFEAMASDLVATELLEILANERTIEARGAALRAEVTPAFPVLYEALDEPLTISRSRAEQSNTSIRYGQQIMLKLLRRFEPYPHPEVEIGRHLGDRPALSPRLAGVVSLDAGERSGPVAVAHEFVWNREDGWEFTVGTCRHFLDEHIGEAPPPPSRRHPLTLALEPPSPANADDRAGPEYAEHLRILGARTAELHRALGDARGDAAFEPEPLTDEDLRVVTVRVRERLARAEPTLRRLATGDDGLDPRGVQQARDVLDLVGRLDGWLADAAVLPEEVAKIRVHGDYHLGQVLLVDGGFVILDFEGEVGLPIEERRRKASVFTDLAGMLRSFSYAAIVAQRAQAQLFPDVEPAMERLAGWTAWWEDHAASSFLSAYMSSADGAPFLPEGLEARRRLLDLFLLDKALHELHYEVEHRPDWVSVPLEGLARIVRHLAEEAA